MQVICTGHCLTTGLFSPLSLPSDWLHGDPKQDKKLVGVSKANVKKTERIVLGLQNSQEGFFSELPSSGVKWHACFRQQFNISKGAEATM